ncbi:hypothetical protein AMBR_JPGBJEAN_02786 [Lacticaseibacillus rhamnosus]|nr:hypothetical protein AMBR_JPGBJEAN_02786 [Lacticaseibacillus rhamnosus]
MQAKAVGLTQGLPVSDPNSFCLLYTSPSPRQAEISYAVFCLKKKNYTP